MHVFKTADKWHISVNGGYAVFNDNGKNNLVALTNSASDGLCAAKSLIGGVYMSDSGTYQIDNAHEAERMIEEFKS